MPPASREDESAESTGSRRLESLVPEVYTQLRDVAERYFRQQADGHTLQPTALVHECYLRLVSLDEPKWRDRTHFYRVAALAMRQILINHARSRGRLRRGGGRRRVALDAGVLAFGEKPADLEALDEALDTLAEEHPRQAHVVELRFFGGLSIEQVARALDISTATVKREWTSARSWLHDFLEGGVRETDSCDGPPSLPDHESG